MESLNFFTKSLLSNYSRNKRRDSNDPHLIPASTNGCQLQQLSYDQEKYAFQLLFIIKNEYYPVRNKRTGYDLKKPNDFVGGSGGYAP